MNKSEYIKYAKDASNYTMLNGFCLFDGSDVAKEHFQTFIHLCGNCDFDGKNPRHEKVLRASWPIQAIEFITTNRAPELTANRLDWMVGHMGALTSPLIRPFSYRSGSGTRFENNLLLHSDKFPLFNAFDVIIDSIKSVDYDEKFTLGMTFVNHVSPRNYLDAFFGFKYYNAYKGSLVEEVYDQKGLLRYGLDYGLSDSEIGEKYDISTLDFKERDAKRNELFLEASEFIYNQFNAYREKDLKEKA